MNTHSERILAILEYCNMKAGDFAETVGVAAATISNIKNGKSSFTAAIAQKIIASFPNFSFQWILLGEGNMLQNAENKSNNVVFPPSKRQTDELFPLDSDEEPENSNLAPITNEVVAPVVSPASETTSKVIGSGNRASSINSASLNKTVSPGRSIEKIIIYYSDKTFEEYDMTKCRL